MKAITVRCNLACNALQQQLMSADTNHRLFSAVPCVRDNPIRCGCRLRYSYAVPDGDVRFGSEADLVDVIADVPLCAAYPTSHFHDLSWESFRSLHGRLRCLRQKIPRQKAGR